MRYLYSFILSFILTKLIIIVSKCINIEQPISKYLPTHMAKQGTPTMGGIAIIVSFFVVSLLYPYYSDSIWIYQITAIYFLTGLIDDMNKVYYKDNRGLIPIYKLFVMFVPILAILWIQFGISWMIPLYFLVILTSSAAFDLTDGLDSLLSSISITIFITVAVLFPELYSMCMIISGSILGFMVFNFKPAQIFMGDCGSLAIGALFGCMMIYKSTYMPFLFLCIVPIVELLSVLLKKMLIKAKMKHNFFIAPIHHTIEKKLSETWTVALLFFITLCVSIATYYYYNQYSSETIYATYTSKSVASQSADIASSSDLITE